MTLGTTYLLHFDRPYKHARHYVGFSRNLAERLKLHRLGQSNAKLMRVVFEAGIGFRVARVWPNTTYYFERRVHNLWITGICPICSPHDAARRAQPRISDYQERKYQPPPSPLPEVTDAIVNDYAADDLPWPF